MRESSRSGSRSDTTSGAKEKKQPNSKENNTSEKQHKPEPAKKNLPEGFPDHYGCLKIRFSSSYTEIAQAARKRRIEVHPDKLKKPGMSDEELLKIDEIAKQVGWAADILLDERRKAKYDRELEGHLRKMRS